MRACSILILLLAACTAPPTPPEPLSPATSGGTLYILDTYEDFFDDNSKLHDPTQGPLRILGEQGLQIVLRSAQRGRNARLRGSVWAELATGKCTDFKVTRPLKYLEPLIEELLRSHGKK